MRVTALYSTPVKGLRVTARSRVTLERGGVRGDRRFYLVDERGRMVNGKQLGVLNEMTATLDEAGILTLSLPGGERIAGAVEPGELVATTFFSKPREAQAMRGPFSAALSDAAGRSLRLVAPSDGSTAVDRGEQGGVSLMSRASLARVAEFADAAELDARRFRMSIELDGVAPFAEDGWVGRELVVADARLSIHGHVGRCLVTSRDPESGEVDLPTLDILRSLRGPAATTEPLAFGVYGEVLRPGDVAVGDRVDVA